LAHPTPSKQERTVRAREHDDGGPSNDRGTSSGWRGLSLRQIVITSMALDLVKKNIKKRATRCK